ncbi:MAG: coproporphyrinogen dehydrogenase HemZ [Clostridiales bacterium]|nr:coproporphyrinogen dehydrogenase HemZ [Clostridiales bacterium]
MIYIILSDRAYDNDVRPIVKSFYPDVSIEIVDKSALIAYQPSDPDGSIKDSSLTLITINIEFEKDRVNIKIKDSQGADYNSFVHTPDPVKERPAYKNAMKRLLYKMLSNLTEKELPWGILTGIRPTKLVYEMLEDGIDEEGIYRWMGQEYLCSEDRINTSILIARREMQLLKELDYRSGYSIYIGIPFCPSTCLYCSFPSFSIERYADLVDSYLDALEKEISYGASCLPNRKLSTVYLGGGTPTSLSAKQLDRLLGLIRESFDFTHVREFCVEAGRPDSITKEKLDLLKKWGVDRISINPQTMQQRTLDLIGRGHTISQIDQAFQMARDSGHENINMDIIIGLPGETPDDVIDTLDKIKLLNPDSLTVHTLAIKRAARLNTEIESYKGLRAEDVPKMLQITKDFMRDNNYLPYYLYRQKNMADNLENIGYAKHGKEGLYNILIMEEKQTILAFGAGAMSKFVFHNRKHIERVDNVKSPKDYISRIDEMIRRKKDFLSKNPDL